MSGEHALSMLLIVLAIGNLACVAWNVHNTRAVRAERRELQRRIAASAGGEQRG